MKNYDFIIIGSGIIGLTMGFAIKEKKPTASVLILDKENAQAQHASGRNSGVLHSGFYYTADSLKAKFTRDGNKQIREYCIANHLKINESKKVVVAQL